MTVSVQGPYREPKEPKEPKKDPLDQILKGLSIASTIYGMKVDSEKIEMMRAEKDAARAEKQSAQERQSFSDSGGMTQGELNKAIAMGQVKQVDEKTPGAMQIPVRTASGQTNAFIMPTKTIEQDRSQALAEQAELKKARNELSLGEAMEKSKEFSFMDPQEAETSGFAGTPAIIVDAQGNQKQVVSVSRKDIEAKDRELERADKKAAEELARQTKFTDGQTTAALYANRLQDAGTIIEKLETAQNFDPTDPKLVVERYAPEMFKSQNLKQLEQAERNFVNAVLRRESGAVISDSEFANARAQYFPAPNDGKIVLEQKRQNRLAALDGLRVASGGAWEALGQRRAQTASQGRGQGRGAIQFEQGMAFGSGDLPALGPSTIVPGTIIERGGILYRVDADGDNLIPVNQ